MAKKKTPAQPQPEAEEKLRRFRKAARRHFDIIDSSTASNPDKLRAYHAIGQEVQKWFGDRVEYASSPFEGAEAVVGHKASWLQKLRKFAALYSQRELKEVCRLDGISWGHVRLVLPLPPRRRSDLLKRVSREQWTTDQLWIELQTPEYRRSKPRGGRPFGGAGSPASSLRQLAELSRKWIAFADQVLLARKKPAAEDSADQKPLAEKIAELSPTATARLGRPLQEAIAKLDELQRAVQQVRKSLGTATESVDRSRRKAARARRARG